MPANLTAIVVAKDEELQIARWLEALRSLDLCVRGVHSSNFDSTAAITRAHDAEVVREAVLNNGESARSHCMKQSLSGWPAVRRTRPRLFPLFLRRVGWGFSMAFRGFLFPLLQGLWYRMIVDVKIYEIELKVRTSSRPLVLVICEKLGISLNRS